MKNKSDKYWDFGLKLVEGCTPVSAGCANCWSLGMEKRFRKETGIVVHSSRMDRPLNRKKPAVYSIWNDLFHFDVPMDFINWAIYTMAACPQHTFLILTKRAERLANLDWQCDWYKSSNIWYGVTVENQANIDRIKYLADIPSPNRFISFEPLLEDLCSEHNHSLFDTDWTKIANWIILGAETGFTHRPCKIEWVQDIVDNYVAQRFKTRDIPVFIKKIEIDGKVTADMSLWPEDLRLRELPWKQDFVRNRK